MAHPVDAARVATNGTGAATECVVDLPAGIQAGDIIIVLFRSASSTSASFPNEGTDWTRFVTSTADASDDITIIGRRVADGSEGGGTVTITTNNSAKFAAIAWRITGGSTVEAAGTVTGSSQTPNPGNLAPAAGSKDYLWLWMGGWEGEQTSPPASNPANYSNVVGANTGTGGQTATNCRVAGASRQNTAASEDPGSWTLSASDDWCAFTVAVHPVASTPQAVDVTGGGTAALATQTTHVKAIAASGTGTAALARQVSHKRTVAASGTGTPALTKQISKPVVVSGAGTAALTKQMAVPIVVAGGGDVLLLTSFVVAQAIAVLGGGVAALVTALAFNRTIAASGTGAVALTARTVLGQTVAVIGAGAAALATLFIPDEGGGDGPGRRWWRRLRLLRRRWFRPWPRG